MQRRRSSSSAAASPAPRRSKAHAEQGFDGRIVLLGGRAAPALRTTGAVEGVPARRVASRAARGARRDAFYADHDVELRTGTAVVEHRPGRPVVRTAAGDRLAYTRLLLATGAAPRRLDVPGADLGRHPSTAHGRRRGPAARRARAARQHVVVVGGGWIGSEVGGVGPPARARRHDGPPQPSPLQAVLGAEVGAVYRDLHADHGVDARAPTRASRRSAARRRVEEVVTDRGARSPPIWWSSASAPRPAIELAVGGRARRRRRRRRRRSTFARATPTSSRPATSPPRSIPHYGTRLRVEHWANALNQGIVAGANLAGGDAGLRPAAVLLLRPVRRRHGVRRLARRVRPRRSPRRRRSARSSPSGSRTTGSSRR